MRRMGMKQADKDELVRILVAVVIHSEIERREIASLKREVVAMENLLDVVAGRKGKGDQRPSPA